MPESFHPHPHVDPRQPRQGSKAGVNPPVFVWKASPETGPFRLVVALDCELKERCLVVDGLTTSMHLPEHHLPTGTLHWRWESPNESGAVLSFELPATAERLVVPSATEWLRRMPEEHPRFLIRPEELVGLRRSIESERSEVWAELKLLADDLLGEPQEMAEPAPLPNAEQDYEAYLKAFLAAMWDSRRFAKGAETLALAYLASGCAAYGQAARQRLLSLAAWDPDGATSLESNDEAHMSVLWYGSGACDWIWNLLAPAERNLLVAHFRRRGQATYEHVRSKGAYGIDRFDSHSGRQIVFLGLVATVFATEIPEAVEWLEWLRPVLCGVWPVWAGDDGAWAEGPIYGMTYVAVMTLFASALKRGAGVDLYRKPFWRAHLRWRRWFFPAYAEWVGFGDHNERWDVFWKSNADLCEVLWRETGAVGFSQYIADLRREAANCYRAPDERRLKGLHPLVLLSREAPEETDEEPAQAQGAHFPAAGAAAVRTSLGDPASDIAILFRSSPFGTISHGHASNNEFAIHVAGRCLALASGFYDGYASAHHAHWVWHTKSHNCLTISDGGQRMRSPDAIGAVQGFFEDERLVYFQGNADASYAELSRCRRHVVYLKNERCALLIDDIEMLPERVGSLQWNIHSWEPFELDETRRTFRLQRGAASMVGHFLYHREAFFTLGEGWDPAPLKRFEDLPWFNQRRLRLSLGDVVTPRRRLGVLLSFGGPGWTAADVSAVRDNGWEKARVGSAEIMVSAESTSAIQPDAAISVNGFRYEIDSAGLRALPV
jgi:hypothetical protein